MEELVIIAWDGIAKGHAVIDWQLFSTKFLSAMEKAWGKKLFWRKLCLILYKQMSQSFPEASDFLLTGSTRSARGGFRTPEMFRSTGSGVIQTPEMIRSPGGPDMPLKATEQISCKEDGKDDPLASPSPRNLRAAPGAIKDTPFA